MGGPLDGEGVGGWQGPDDTYEVFQVAQASDSRTKRPLRAETWNVRGRTRGIWASELPYTFAPAGTRLGHYRLDLGTQSAIWVAA